jgi:hypothetical protein
MQGVAHSRSSKLAIGVAAVLLVCCVAALNSQAAAWQRARVAQQPAPLVHAAAGPAAPMASPEAPLSAEALSSALWVRLSVQQTPLGLQC